MISAMKRLREKIEAIVFAGMKPGQKPQAATTSDTPTGRLRARIGNWILGGPAPSDPLYLSNRTMGQKLRAWTVVAVPLVIVIGGVGLLMSRYLNPPDAKPPAEPSPAEIAAKMLPNLSNLKIEGGHDVDVLEVQLERGSTMYVVGTLKNKTAERVAAADLNCDLTDAGGTEFGSVIVRVEDIGPSAVKKFRVAVKPTEATTVMIREINTHKAPPARE